MKKPEKTSPVMEFVFQTIKLDQVANLIPQTYRSKYEAIRNQVIDRIKTMPGDETFLFQPLDKKTKLDDNLIARICHGINTGIVRESLNWKISFSVKAKAFVVAPFKRNKRGKRGEPQESKLPVIRATAAANPDDSVTQEEREQVKNLLIVTHQHFGKTLKDLQTKLSGTHDPELANLKKAFLYVGRNAMGVKLSHLGRLIGLQSSSTTTMCQEAMKNPTAKEYVKVLSDAVTSNGGGH